MTENSITEESLYSPEIIKIISEDKTGLLKLNPPVTLKNPGENLVLRPLKEEDYDRGYLQLLSQLTKVGEYSKEEFLERFHEMKKCSDTYYITVIEDLSISKVIATATLAIERKFIRNISKRGRMEDVVVSDDYRGKQLGKLLIAAIQLLAKYTQCYKLTLDCKDKMIDYYKNMGFNLEEGNNTTMTIRYSQ